MTLSHRLARSPGHGSTRVGALAVGRGAALLDRRAWRLLIGFLLLDAALIVCGPVTLLSAHVVDAGPGSSIAARVVLITAIDTLVVIPVQVLVVWLLLGHSLREARRLRRRAAVIDRVLHTEGVRTFVQPIVEARGGRVVGFEALTRFPGIGDESPERVFRDARRMSRGRALELLSVRSALAASSEAPDETYVSINVSPGVLADPELLSLLLDSDVEVERLVIEVTEDVRVDDYDALRASRDALRVHGIRFAVDDAGAGYASLRHVAALDPDIVKIDRSLVHGVRTDPARAEVIRALVQFARRSGIVLVAEGVETDEDLGVVADLGVDHVQGLLSGGPRPRMRPRPGVGVPA